MYIGSEMSRVCRVRHVIIAWGTNAMVVHMAAQNPIIITMSINHPIMRLCHKLNVSKEKNSRDKSFFADLCVFIKDST